MGLVKKLVVIPAVAVGDLAAGGIAWATLGGAITGTDVITGIATGTGSNSCQTGGLTFDVPSPTWNNSAGDYVVSTVDYSGIATACVNLGTADLIITVTANGSTQSIATATASNLSSATGTLSLSTPVSFDEITNGRIYYLVENS